MNELLSKYNDYLKLVGCKIEYELENHVILSVSYREDAFLHLLGIHKLTDIQLVQFWLDRNNPTVKRRDVIRRIINESFTDTHVRNSIKFPEIRSRYENFDYNNLTSLNYTDAIIDFDRSLANSTLKSDYILFAEKNNNEYDHMGIAVDWQQNRYIETFFHEPSDQYLAGQNILKVIKFTMRKQDGSVLVSDTYEYNQP